ncbi:MAG: cbb3-type cytochrome c oxidase subunit 3 [Nitrosomonadales bacterium]|nr:cbb3-type cytochrome c oxidase subunit 3 [Nitrosomonadales bacterium]
MTRLMEYLHTDWGAMSRNDWIGVTLTVLAFVAMIAIYALVFNPRNKEALNSQGDMALRDEGEHNNFGGRK